MNIKINFYTSKYETYKFQWPNGGKISISLFFLGRKLGLLLFLNVFTVVGLSGCAP